MGSHLFISSLPSSPSPRISNILCSPLRPLEFRTSRSLSRPGIPPAATMIGPGKGMLGEDGIHVDMNHLKSGEVNLGTSIMAINFKDGVILGADSRTTTGAYIANRVTDKLTQVHDTIWCCRSGSAADTQAVADIVSYHLGMYGIMNNEPPTTQTAAALFQELCYENKDQDQPTSTDSVTHTGRKT